MYFSDYFEIDHDLISDYGALDISLISDSPAFVDPFLIFFSNKPEYNKLQKFMGDYLSFLKDTVDKGEYELNKRNFLFQEVEQVWLGYSLKGNKGSGLGHKFAESLKNNLPNLKGGSTISSGEHIEKLCILGERIGVDKISDFTLNLIKSYLIDFTQKFALENIPTEKIYDFNIEKSVFDFYLGEWKNKNAKLPFITNSEGKKEYILLTPKDILIKDDSWISKNDFLSNDYTIINRIPNEEKRSQVNKYFMNHIPDRYNRKTKQNEKALIQKNVKPALHKTARKYPILLDYYIKRKEENGEEALKRNEETVDGLETFAYEGVTIIREGIKSQGIANIEGNSLSESIEKIKILKDYLEKRGGDKVFWTGKKLKYSDEKVIQFMLDLSLSSSRRDFSVDKEVDNGRGAVDFKISKGVDSTLIETKLASNSQMKSNLKNQLKIYQEANDTQNGLYVIVFFTNEEKLKLNKIIKDLEMDHYIGKKIFIIDCTKKESASKVK